MIKKNQFLIIIILIFLMTGCANVQVSQDYSADYVFGIDNSFGWNKTFPRENSGLLQQDELLAKRFKKAIENALVGRGFQQSSSPELLVSCVYTVSPMLRSDPVNSGFGFGYGRYGRYGTIGINSGTSIRQYQQGMLMINIHSARSGGLIWKGTGTREVYTHSSPEDISNMVTEIVNAVVNQFPPTR
ncbi:MAG: DUF4136 domain-containing protein [Desulforhopalus sp.]